MCFSTSRNRHNGCLNAATLALLPLLGGCLYAETPQGRVLAVDLPVHSQSTVNKTVTVNAPPGATVVYQEGVPVSYPYGVYPVYPAYPVYPDRPEYPPPRRRTRR